MTSATTPMRPARLMDRPADYEKLGVNPDRVEPWEDGRRHDGRSGNFEWVVFRRDLRRRHQAGRRLLPQAPREGRP